MTKSGSKYSAGDWVEVRSKEEILRTLDSKAQLEGMPFMPEMFAFCGKRFQVFKRAHKTCDTVHPIRGRRVNDTVHLDTRCDGQAHGGCQARCLLFWKDAWLRPVDSKSQEFSSQTVAGKSTGCTEEEVKKATLASTTPEGAPIYACQATLLPGYTTELDWWDISQYVEDYTSGNAGLWRIFTGFLYSCYYNLSQAGIGLGGAMRWAYNLFSPLRGGKLFPRTAGPIPRGQRTPAETLNLQPGELVRVKSHAEILKTLDIDSRNRGMTFDAELVPFCGRTFRVLERVNVIIDEKSGKLIKMTTPCIILEGVACESRYSGCRMFCPRSIYAYWREIWLERVGAPKPASAADAVAKPSVA